MNRTDSAPPVLRGTFRHLLILALLAWSGGCAVEDPIARLRVVDSGTGTSFSTDDDEALLLGEDSWELAPPDCAEAEQEVDSGVACEDAGTPDVP